MKRTMSIISISAHKNSLRLPIILIIIILTVKKQDNNNKNESITIYKKTYKNCSELINKFSKVTRYKISIRVFPYTDNKLPVKGN